MTAPASDDSNSLRPQPVWTAQPSSNGSARPTTTVGGIWPRSQAGTSNAPRGCRTGPGTYGRFPAIRAFDFWVHERDITTPLARVTDDTGFAAKIALAEVESSLGYIVGKKAGCPRARQRVGRDRAVDLILRAKTVSGPEALRLGLVTQVWPNAELK